ncbi:MAG: hypothetical protein IT434_12930 [Phycisphaerales bacterium]|jgi:hypothetical protein|nr:hypothetical protein [Phycisphaerales bacterium]
MPGPTRSGLSTLVAVAAGTVLLLAGVGAYVSNNIWIASRATHALPVAKVSQTDANRQLRNVLVRAGLGADNLAAAGVNSSKTAEVVAAVRDVLTEQGAALKSADESHRANSVLRQQLLAKVQAGTSTEQDRAALTTAESTIASAGQTRAGVLSAAIAAANAVLSSEQVLALAAIRTLPSDLPLKYRAASMNSGQADTLRAALGEARAADAVGEEPSSSTQTLITSYDNNQAVANAHSNLTNNATSVRTAWDQAVGH